MATGQSMNQTNGAGMGQTGPRDSLVPCMLDLAPVVLAPVGLGLSCTWHPLWPDWDLNSMQYLLQPVRVDALCSVGPGQARTGAV